MVAAAGFEPALRFPQKQILSPPEAAYPKFLCGLSLSGQRRRNADDIKGNALTNGDTLCHRLPRLSHFGDDIVMTRKQPPQKLTDSLLRRLPAPVRGNTVTFDITVKGFGARTTAAGARAFILNYRRKADGRQRQFTIGSYPVRYPF